MRRLLCILVVLLLASQAWGTVYYVDQGGGNDSNPGTATTNPWKTISKVNSSSFSPGDSILFKKGETWRETLTVPSSGNAGNTITFGAYGNGNLPIIDGSIDILGSTRDWAAASTPNVWFKNIGSVSFPYKTPNLWLNGKYGTLLEKGTPSKPGEYQYTNPNIYLYSVGNPASTYTSILRSSLQNGVVATGKNYITVENLVFNHFNHIAWSTTWVQHDGAIAFNNSAFATVQNNTILNVSAGINFAEASLNPIARNNSITNVYHLINYPYGIGIAFNDKNALIDNNTIDMLSADVTSGNIRTGIGIYSRAEDGKVYNYFPSNATISNNTIYNFGGFGVFFINYDNTSAHNGTALNWDIHGNYIHDSKIVRSGDLDSDCIGMGSFINNMILPNALIYRNRVENCNNAGIQVSNSLGIGVHIYYNTVSHVGFIGTPTQGGIVCNNGCKIYNNTIYDVNARGIASSKYTPVLTAEKNEIRNNIIHTIGLSSYGIWAGYGGADDGSQTEGSNNLIYNVPSGHETYLFTNTNGLRSDPLFVSPATGDFHLQVSSPATNAGTNVGLTTDYEGNLVPNGSAPDMGAFEYQGGIPRPQKVPGFPKGLSVE